MITVLRLTIIVAAMHLLAAVAGPGHSHAAPWDPVAKILPPMFARQRAFGHTCP